MVSVEKLALFSTSESFVGFPDASAHIAAAGTINATNIANMHNSAVSFDLNFVIPPLYFRL